jgi:hypothetical protein
MPNFQVKFWKILFSFELKEITALNVMLFYKFVVLDKKKERKYSACPFS